MANRSRRGDRQSSPQALQAEGEADAKSETGAGDVAAGKPKLSRAEAGRLGGLKTRERYGSEHYKDIGKQGGAKGGAVTKQKYGSEHYRRIGSLRGKKSAYERGQGSSSR